MHATPVILVVLALTSLAGYMGGWTMKEGDPVRGFLMLLMAGAMSIVGAALFRAPEPQKVRVRRPRRPTED